MPVASVTIESLNNVKKAFSDFQTDVESFSDKINSSTEQILTEVKQSVKKQENLVVVLEKKVSSLVNEIEQIQSSIISVNSSISSLKTEIVNLERQKPQLEACISQLEQQKRQIEAQKNNSDGDTSGIGAQIRAIENQIQSCRRQLQQINEQISSAKQQQADNERKSAELKENKVRKDNELSTTRGELGKAKSKYERLSAAGDSVEREIENLNIAARKFEQNATASNASSKSGIERCIAFINEYEAVNFSNSNVGISASVELTHQRGNIREILSVSPSEMRDRMLFEISVLRNDLELTDGNPALPQLGGTHREVRNQLRELGLAGFQAHHIPSAAAQGANYRQDCEYWESLPTIAISNADHLDTDSYGGRQRREYQSFLPDVPRSSSYCSEVTDEIENGNYVDVVRMELYNIRDHFGHDYDGGISRYLDALEAFLQDNH